MRNFRAKRIDNGEEIKGGLFERGGKSYIIPSEGRYGSYSETKFGTKSGEPRTLIGPAIEVDPATIGQSTGLKDKNGVEIFEGDKVNIVRLDNNAKETAFVEWSPEDCGFCYSVGEQRRCVYRANTNMLPEIIGTIHSEGKDNDS